MSIVPTNINNYLRQFAYQLEERILQQFPPLHQPGEPLPAELARLRRTPYPAQALAIAGIAKRWEAENSAGAAVILSNSWPNRPRLWFNSLRPNYGLASTGGSRARAGSPAAPAADATPAARRYTMRQETKAVGLK